MILWNKRLTGILVTIAVLLLLPLAAMLFTNEVHWTLFDFVAAAALLLGTGLSCEFVIRNVKKTTHRVAICAVILAALVLIWLELAVGIFGSPLASQ